MSTMRTLRGIVEGPYGRWVMLGLLLFLLVIFTVTDEMTNWLQGLGGGGNGVTGDTVAGTFSVLKGSQTEVTWSEFDQARARYRMLLRLEGANAEPGEIAVWTHLVLRAAAERAGITVSDQDVAETMKARVPPNIWVEPTRYKKWVRDVFKVSAAELEHALREFMITDRLHQLYQESFEVGPPTSREEAITNFATQNVEYARGHVAVLPAARFLQDAEDEFARKEDPEAALREFYESDPDVKTEDDAFRNPRRYQMEILYTIHRNLTPENYKRVEALFQKAYPDLDVSRLEVPIKEQREFYGLYRDRLLEEAGTSYGEIRQEEMAERKEKEGDDPAKSPAAGDVKESPGEEKPGEDKPGEGGEKPEETGEEKPEEGGEKPEEAGEEKPEDGDAPLDETLDPQALRDALADRGFAIVQDQIDRELRVRGMYEWFATEARKAGNKTSLKVLFDTLAKHDDAENPVCATEPGKGLIVYRDFGGQYLSREELENLEDSGVKFTHNFPFRVNQLGDTDLPKLYHKADVLGYLGHGRQIFRLLDVKRPSRKTFAELTEGEKADLKEKWAIPSRARALAKEQLDALRTKLVEGEVKTEDFAKEARALGCRVHEDEWYEASQSFLAEPDKALYWPDAYLKMRDRYFLHSELTSVLRRDRIKKELKAGSVLEVMEDTRREADDPGAAYLFLLLERREPDARTIPQDEMNEYMNYARFSRRNEMRERWGEDVRRLFSDFGLVFHGEMDKRVKEEIRKREEARKRNRS